MCGVDTSMSCADMHTLPQSLQLQALQMPDEEWKAAESAPLGVKVRDLQRCWVGTLRQAPCP